MKNLREYLEEQINENLIQAVLSAGRNKDGISKIKIRPIRLKGQICYQASATEGQKVLHKNYGRTELIILSTMALTCLRSVMMMTM